jgi:copper chaperone CopZ
MKKIFSLVLLTGIMLFSFAENSLLNLKVSGMHCGGCEMKFKSAAAGIKGISEVKEVSAEKGSATISYDPAQITAEKAVQSLAENTGFTISATTALGEVQSEGKPSGCCMKGQKSAGCKKP